jgi:ribosome-binding protein aMBF1 (putative translation factor)
MDKCEVCGADVRELRRGRCWGCYTRWVEARPVGLGASCRFCGERRSTYLRSIELLGSWMPACHNCAARIATLEPMPPSVVGVREALKRERRDPDRRADRPDPRTSPFERRGGERRHAARLASTDGVVSAMSGHQLGRSVHESAPLVDDDMVVEVAELASELESLADELTEVGDLTRIHELHG